MAQTKKQQSTNTSPAAQQTQAKRKAFNPVVIHINTADCSVAEVMVHVPIKNDGGKVTFMTDQPAGSQILITFDNDRVLSPNPVTIPQGATSASADVQVNPQHGKKERVGFTVGCSRGGSDPNEVIVP